MIWQYSIVQSRLFQEQVVALRLPVLLIGQEKNYIMMKLELHMISRKKVV